MDQLLNFADRSTLNLYQDLSSSPHSPEKKLNDVDDVKALIFSFILAHQCYIPQPCDAHR